MKTAFLIGFQYSDRHYLTASKLDIYRAYEWCKTFDCQINIGTDFQFDVEDNDLPLGSEINSLTKFVDNAVDLEKILVDICWRERNIIYYTGHGIPNGIFLPDQSSIGIINLRNKIMKLCTLSSEFLWIIDCCNSTGLALPFKLEDNCFKLSPSPISPVQNKILLITSSRPEEKAIATGEGSLFTKNIFEYFRKLKIDDTSCISVDEIKSWLSGKNRNLSRLVGRINAEIRKSHTGYRQTVSIYTSHMQDPILWLWIGNDSDVVTDSSLKIIIIRN